MARPKKMDEAAQAAVEAEGIDRLLKTWLNSSNTPWVQGADGNYSKVRETCGVYNPYTLCGRAATLLQAQGIENPHAEVVGDGLRVTISEAQFCGLGGGVHVQRPTRHQVLEAARGIGAAEWIAAHNVHNAQLLAVVGEEGFAAALRPQESDAAPATFADRVKHVKQTPAENPALDGKMRKLVLNIDQWRGVGGDSTDKKLYVTLPEGVSVADIRASVKRVLGKMNVQAKNVDADPNNDARVVVRISAKTLATLQTEAQKTRGR